MRIQGIKIKNTGVFKDESIEFEKLKINQGAELHIFTGPNGSGKSTILHALAAGFNSTSSSGRCNVAHNDFHKRFHYYERESNDSFKSEIKIKLENGEEIDCYGCPDCTKMHIVTKSNLVKNYQTQMGLDQGSNLRFDFALYASSSYSMADYQLNQENASYASTNPLAQSLEFEKKQIHTQSIEEWIKQALLNKYAAIGQAQNGDLDAKPQIHAQVIDRIIEAIRKIVGTEFDLILQLQPQKVQFKDGKSKNKVEFNLLADGIKSLISWMADLARMLDELYWKDQSISILDQNVIIFLDEIEVHLHPLWQRKVLPIVSSLFPNAQIFISTHSPFVVNSVDGAWIYKLGTDSQGVSKVLNKHLSSTANSYLSEFISTFGVEEEFGEGTQHDLDLFQNKVESLNNDSSPNDIENVKILARKLLERDSIAIDNTVAIELRRLSRLKNIEICL